MPTNKKIAIIGSGFGGLSAAIRLQAAGFETRIFEKRDMAGGRAYVYREKGFTFDAGPTVITAPECIEELFALKNKKMSDYVQLISVMPFYRLLWDDGFIFDYSNDDAKLFPQIEKNHLKMSKGIKSFYSIQKKFSMKGILDLCMYPF